MIKSPEEQQKLSPFEGLDSRRILWKMLSTRANSRSRSRSKQLSKKLQSQIEHYGFFGIATENKNMSDNTVLPVKPSKVDVSKYRSNRPKKPSNTLTAKGVKDTYTPKRQKKSTKPGNKSLLLNIKKKSLKAKKSSFNSKFSIKSKTEKKDRSTREVKPTVHPCSIKNALQNINIKKKSFRIIKESIYKENKKLKSWFTRRRTEINKDFNFQIKKKTLDQRG